MYFYNKIIYKEFTLLAETLDKLTEIKVTKEKKKEKLCCTSSISWT